MAQDLHLIIGMSHLLVAGLTGLLALAPAIILIVPVFQTYRYARRRVG